MRELDQKLAGSFRQGLSAAMIAHGWLFQGEHEGEGDFVVLAR
jgi:hypothetical protein